MLMDDVTRPATAAATTNDGRLRRLLARIRDRLSLWRERERERLWLAEFNDHMLKDIGLSRSELRREVDKPFWKP